MDEVLNFQRTIRMAILDMQLEGHKKMSAKLINFYFWLQKHDIKTYKQLMSKLGVDNE